MNPFFEYFRRERPFIDPDSSKWPPQWSVVRFKAYPRFPKVSLPEPALDGRIALRDAFLHRRSDRDFKGTPLSLQEISNLLYFSCGITRPTENPKRARRAQPSGGGLYPLELYLSIQKESREIAKGVYHYNILEHCLERLPTRNMELLERLFVYPWARSAALLLLFTFIGERNMPKYGNFAYKIGLIEAGHIGQNVYLNCAVMDLKCCSLGGVNEENAHALLDIDGVSEVAFYAMAIGK